MNWIKEVSNKKDNAIKLAYFEQTGKRWHKSQVKNFEKRVYDGRQGFEEYYFKGKLLLSINVILFDGKPIITILK